MEQTSTTQVTLPLGVSGGSRIPFWTRRLHLILCVVHGGLLALMIYAAIFYNDRGVQVLYKHSETWSRQCSTLWSVNSNVCPSCAGSQCIQAPDRKWGWTSIGESRSAVALCVAISATFTTSLLSFMDYHGKYTLTGVKALFFTEYAVSATMMLWVIMVHYAGAFELIHALRASAATVAAMAIGGMMDSIRFLKSRDLSLGLRDRQLIGWTFFLGEAAAWLVQASIWIPVLVSVLASDNVPSYVPFIVIVEMILFSCFGLVQTWFHHFSTADVHHEVLCFTLLSATAKIFLVIMLSANVFFN